jgi:hypothetical protein
VLAGQAKLIYVAAGCWQAAGKLVFFGGREWDWREEEVWEQD